MAAARNGQEQVALVLLEAKADPNQAKSDGATALMCAAENGHEQVALVLLKAGAVVSSQDDLGRTAWMAAANDGHEQVALVLLEAKADPNQARPDGLTALMFAAANGHEQVALVLLEAGAASFLMAPIIAALRGNIRCARVLLKQKANGFWRSLSEIVRWLLAPLLLAFAVAMYFRA
jgi:ankyrin repeat protein